MMTWLTAQWGDFAPLLAMPAFMPGFRKKAVAAAGTTGQPMGLLLALTYAS